MNKKPARKVLQGPLMYLLILAIILLMVHMLSDGSQQTTETISYSTLLEWVEADLRHSQGETLPANLYSAVYQEEAVVPVSAGLAQPVCQLRLQGILHAVAVEAEFLQLLCHLAHIVRVAVPYAYHCVPSVEVEVLLSIGVPHAATLAAFYGHVEKWVYVE